MTCRRLLVLTTKLLYRHGISAPPQARLITHATTPPPPPSGSRPCWGLLTELRLSGGSGMDGPFHQPKFNQTGKCVAKVCRYMFNPCPSQVLYCLGTSSVVSHTRFLTAADIACTSGTFPAYALGYTGWLDNGSPSI